MAFPLNEIKIKTKTTLRCMLDSIVCITISITMDYNNLYSFIYPVCVGVTCMSMDF